MGPHNSCFRLCLANPAVNLVIQTIRWIPVIFIVSVLSWGYYVYVFQLCFFTVTNVFKRGLYLLVFHLLLVMLMWTYYRTIFATVRRPPAKFFLPSLLRRDLDNCDTPNDCHLILDRFVHEKALPISMRTFEVIRYCNTCGCVKPDRCHHCSVCGHCVLKFDHHCPWVNTCIGFGNYKFFLQFMGYTLVFCLWAFFTILPYFVHFWQKDISHRLREGGGFHILFGFFVTGMFALSVSFLFFYHLYLTARNQSTIESFRAPMFLDGTDKNAYNLGVWANFIQVFGANRPLWFVPIFSSRHNGLVFPVATVTTHFSARDPPCHQLADVPSMQ